MVRSHSTERIPRARSSFERLKPTITTPLTSVTGTPVCPDLRFKAASPLGDVVTSTSLNGMRRSLR
jgi:hypothetical protein